MRSPLWQPLGIRSFRLLWLGEGISLFGDQFFLVALPWIVLRAGGAGAAVGGILMVSAFPRALLILAGGAVADRFSPRAIMIASNLARAGLVALLAGLIGIERGSLALLSVFAFGFGIVDAFFFPAYSSIVPSLVASELLPAAHGVLQGTMRLSMLVGPAAAGWLVATAGVVPALAFAAASFGVAAVVLAAMKPEARGGAGFDTATTSALDTLRSIRDGLAYSWHDRLTRAFLLILAVINFSFIGPFIVGLATMAQRQFGGPTAFGAALSALGGGTMVGSLVSGTIALQHRRGLIWLGICFALGFSQMTLGLVSSFPLLLVVIGIMGVGAGFMNVVMTAWLQQRTPPEMIGRVMSVALFAAVGLSPISYGVAGLLVDTSPVLMFAAAGLLVAGATAVVATDAEVRKMD